jgi:hypothetical protein
VKKIKPIYFFVFSLGIVGMIVALSILFVGDSNHVFFIVIGVAIAAVLIKVSIDLSNGTLEQRTKIFKECVKCKEEIDVNSDFCKYCGAKQNDTVPCDFCGELNHENDTVCSHCNALLK